MPHLPSSDGAIDTFKLPESGVTVTMKRRASGRDHNEALQATVGEGYNARHAYARYLGYLAPLLITAWDAQDPDGDVIPISPQTLAAIDSERDHDVLLHEAAKRVQLRGPEAEGPFDPPSTES